MSIRNKLILMLAIPLAALAVVGALGFRTQSSTAQAASEALDQDAVVQSVNTAIKAIGAERLGVTDGVAGDDLDALRRATDARLDEAMAAAADTGETVVETGAASAIADLNNARSSSNLLVAVTEMNQATAELRRVRDEVPVEYPSPDSFAEATSIDMAVDIADLQDSVWLEYVAADEIGAELANRLRTQIATTELLREQIVEIAPETHFGPLNASLGSQMDADIERAGVAAIDRFERGEGPLPDSSTLDAVVASHEDWYGHAVMLQSDVSANLAERSADAEGRQNLFALLGTLGLLILFGLIYVVYRSVVRPLDELLEGAEKIASDRLPSVVAELRTIGSSDADVHLEPLARQSDDELGSLVDAFNNVQLTAFDLAVEQARSRRNIAEMFVNLGRRNQKLLQRMLGVISELETGEQNADKLEQLFQLDHMTTRMRRNAESLLVVAGTTTPRQWAKPVPSAEVLRGALAEVQDYHRIDVLTLADAPMAGNAVADATHLLAELLENSLQFSEPESRVTISSRWMQDSYRIVISDQGFGMTAEELAENNSLIANPPPPDQAPTRFLGLFVVGHLAQRHGIEVVLTDSTLGGTDARVTIPAAIMSEGAPANLDDEDLPIRGDEDDLDLEFDLDAELAELTAEEEGRLDTRQDATIDQFIAEPVALVQDVASEAAEDPAPAETAVADAGPNADAHNADAHSADAHNADAHKADARTVDGGGIDFGELPELPTFERLVADAGLDELPKRPTAPRSVPRAAAAVAVPAHAVSTAPAPAVAEIEGPGRLAAAVPAQELAAMGLPQRTPRATLQPDGSLPHSAASPLPEETTVASAEDVNATATTVSSTFAAFQYGVKRGERKST